ncbi:MAG: CBS domain-containing protein [Chloroflexi bacterium]|nr:MAG: CBS domain-containing protein [Chloroflexota bacterium]
MTLINDVLKTKGHDVWSIRSDASVFDALKLMSEKEIGALLVIDDANLVGVISERDYARKVVLMGRSAENTHVKEIMSPNVVSIQTGQDVKACMTLMTDKRIRHLPVMDGSTILGVVSIGDLVKSIINEQQFVIEQLERYITS